MTIKFNVSTVATSPNPSSLVAADLNSDGNLDLVTNFFQRSLSEDLSGVTVLLGNGAGQFAAGKNYSTNQKTTTPVSPDRLTPSYINDIAVADVNRDGKLDLVTVGFVYITQREGSFLVDRERSIISVLLGDGAGSFSAAQNTFVDRIGDGSSGAAELAIADFNGDGNLDVATVANTRNTTAQDPANNKLVAVLLGDGAGNFGNQRNLSISGNTSDVAVGDFNGDGRADLVVGGSPDYSSGSEDGSFADLTILLNDGTANFSSTSTTPTPFVSSNKLLVGDFNSDGKLDVAYSGGYLVGEGTGRFTQAVDLSGSGLTAAGDLNGDSKLDFATSGYSEVGGSSNTGLSVTFGNGIGKYTLPTTLINNPLFEGLVVGDFNKDGKADVAATNRSDGLSVFLSTATPADTLVIAGGAIDASLQSSGLTVNLSKGTLQLGGQSQKLSDSYRLVIGTEQGDRIIGSRKAENLYGGAGNDKILGLDGSDVLAGGLGNDTLTGGSGKDKFLFSSTVFDRAMGVDKITDFERGKDSINLSLSTFTAFTSRRISFAAVTTQNEAQKSKALITYIAKTGSLFYNQNSSVQGFGTGGQFADLANGLDLSKANISVSR